VLEAASPSDQADAAFREGSCLHRLVEARRSGGRLLGHTWIGSRWPRLKKNDVV
jgi:hypothetical protein